MLIESTALALAAQKPHRSGQTGWSAFLSEPKRLGGWVILHPWMTGAVLTITAVNVVGALWWLDHASARLHMPTHGDENIYSQKLLDLCWYF
jgi:hypothetical protein